MRLQVNYLIQKIPTKMKFTFVADRSLCWGLQNCSAVCYCHVIGRDKFSTRQQQNNIFRSTFVFVLPFDMGQPEQVTEHATSEEGGRRSLAWFWKVRQYVANREWWNIRAGRRRNHFPFHVWLAQNWIGQPDYLAADVCKKLLTAHKNCS